MATAALPQPSRRRRVGARPLWALAASTPVLLALALGWQLWRASLASRQAFGWGFVAASAWNPEAGHFGAWPFLYGTLITTAVAVLLAVPLGVGAAVALSQLVPRWLRRPLRSLFDLMIAVPGVVYGLWGIFVLVPWLRSALEPWLSAHVGELPLFRANTSGFSLLAAGLVLALMVVPFLVGLAEQAIAAVPRPQSEGAAALGCTRWEVIRRVVLPAARPGILAGLLLGTGRALGETMAVAMVVGNRPAVAASLFAPGTTLASAIANEFTEAATPLYTSSLIELGLVLFAITLVVNLIARAAFGRTNTV